MKFDYLDNKTNILYCSKKCAHKVKAYHLIPITTEEFEEQYNADTGDHWGACCPVCEEPYNNY